MLWTDCKCCRSPLHSIDIGQQFAALMCLPLSNSRILLSLVCAGNVHVSASYARARHSLPGPRARYGACAGGSPCVDPGHCGIDRMLASSPLPAARTGQLYGLSVGANGHGHKMSSMETQCGQPAHSVALAHGRRLPGRQRPTSDEMSDEGASAPFRRSARFRRSALRRMCCSTYVLPAVASCQHVLPCYMHSNRKMVHKDWACRHPADH